MSKTLEVLVEQVLVACADPRYERLKQMWTRHNRLEKVEKIPVCVFLHYGYTETWKELIPESELASTDPLEQDIELQLRQKLFRYHHIPDDTVILPTLWMQPVRPVGEARLWGVPLLWQRLPNLPDTLGSRLAVPGLRSEEDLSLLHYPKYEVDEEATQALVDRVCELVGGRLPVKLRTDEIGCSPSEKVLQFLGMERFLYSFVDEPELLHRLMDFATEGHIAYHKDRERHGAVDAEEYWERRVHYEYLPEGLSDKSLCACWTYIAAQSAGGISPAMYAEFIQPYHERLAREVAGEDRVYYHGCENLTRKMDIISKLPNLRRFHVSPWTSLETAVEKLGRNFVLETHGNPATLVTPGGRSQWVPELKHIVAVAGDCIIDINLSDISTVGNDPSVLTQWALTAQEIVGGA